MTNEQLQELIKAIISTNLGLQNALGVYAKNSSYALNMMSKQAPDERLNAIENELYRIGDAQKILAGRVELLIRKTIKIPENKCKKRVKK